MNVYSQLVRAQLQNLAADLSSGVLGLLWFNTGDGKAKVSTASRVEQIVTTEFENEFSLLNNQTTFQPITGLILDKSKVHRAHIEVAIRLRTNTEERDASGRLIAVYKKDADAWEIGYQLLDTVATGLSWNITSAGQVQYKSANMTPEAGFAGYLRWDVIKTFKNFAT